MMSTPYAWSWRLPAWARVIAFVLAAVPAIRYGNQAALLALIPVALVWVAAVVAERRGFVLVVLAEALVTGLVVAVTLTDQGSSLPILLVAPPFVAALHGGLRLMLPAMAIETTIVGAAAAVAVPALPPEHLFAMTTWLLGVLGLGLIGSFVSSTTTPTQPDELAPYRDAQRLLRQLLNLSDNLSSGLDADSLGGVVGSAVRDRLPTSWMAVYVPRGDDLVPLLTKGDDCRRDASATEQLALESWARGMPLMDGDDFAFPLGHKVVIGGVIEASAGMGRDEIERRIELLINALRLPSVQLDTALMFADFRASATADLRRRLAREMHDGVAQDIASLGYIVDALAARPASPQQEKQFTMLRDRITAVVAEVRQSVLTLRTSIGEADSLGVAIGNVARHLSESSQVPIQVTLDERSTRLRSEVEAELFRIAQEAMNNAIKHAHASQIEVHCQVHAPDATITIRDDGRGLQPARSDSHGLKIMRERARLIDADLQLTPNPEGGLVVTVVLDASGTRQGRRPTGAPDLAGAGQPPREGDAAHQSEGRSGSEDPAESTSPVHSPS